MSEENKSFFSSLSPKSALVVGLVGGVLVLCTIGFIVMLVIFFGGKDNSVISKPIAQAATNPTIQQPVTPTVAKADKPVIELFVMSYCPYGLQMEKAYLPAWELLKNKANISIKFVSYAMHGLKEIEENTRQYCIAKNYPAKEISYLNCFTGKDDYKGCLATVGITESSLTSCINSTNAQYKTLDKYNDQTTWLSGRYPVYQIHQDLNDKYGVQGSPTLVINGKEASVSRTPEAVKQAICASFNTAPEECKQTLSTAAPAAGFGGTAGGTDSNVQCE
ncbi:MAG: hypothetical protein US58_C0022G0018 [Candidatus Magasanikbacteria bacterium GW2011_GWA2_37_8]|uniref:Thioredoxin-like fold domain-containing protein n=1 Tax=Candidatus Magasanikbacteria bacterium GW2011_GWA2_37_8 TaxID=1619036 RepID=A0A0G0JTJ9_9BACT|nr:MAG: hypothetical protein US58_C0022G0018 [Candidatus Magasanikbacteria bacterium GW2011_GWA2_37_8]